MNLVIGATGVLGTEICRLLRQSGKAVRGLVRSSASEEKKNALQTLGVEAVQGDLKDPKSLEEACKGVDAILSTATCIVSQQPGDSLIRTDLEGHLALIESAEKAGVKKFVFISFPPSPYEFPLQTAKRGVEQRLQTSAFNSTVLQPTLFQEVWLGPHLGFDAANRKARIYGNGNQKISWISFRDVATFAVMSLEKGDVQTRIIPLGGPEALSPLEVVRMCEEMSGEKFAVEHVPEEALKSQYESATEPLPRTFAALMLKYAGGEKIDMEPVLKSMPVQMHSVRQYIASVLGK